MEITIVKFKKSSILSHDSLILFNRYKKYYSILNRKQKYHD